MLENQQKKKKKKKEKRVQILPIVGSLSSIFYIFIR